MKHLIVPTINVYVLNDSKLLFGRRAATGWMDGFLCPPGGHVEVGETPRVAMIREIEEELGVSVKPNDLEFFCVAARNTTPNETVAYGFVIRDKDYSFINAEPDKCSELVWVNPTALPDDVIPDFRTIVDHGLLGGERYLEIDYAG